MYVSQRLHVELWMLFHAESKIYKNEVEHHCLFLANCEVDKGVTREQKAHTETLFDRRNEDTVATYGWLQW